MPDYSFLFKYFQEGDKILLYARGKNGREIYQFLKAYPQYTIVGFVDRNADKLTDVGVPVYGPGQLKSIPPEAYDKIVITVIKQDMGRGVWQIIQKSGVDKAKVVAPYTYIGPETACALEDFIENPAVCQGEIGRFISLRYGDLAYFEPLVQGLKGKRTERAALLKRFKQTARQLPTLENIVFLHILYLSDIFDAELMKRLMELILKVDQPELRQFLHGLFNSTTYMCFWHPEYLFPEFYDLRRQFLQKMCEMYDLHMDESRIRKRNDGKIKKICVLSHMLFDKGSSTTLASVQMSNLLADLGYEVAVLPLDAGSYVAVGTPVFRPILYVMYEGSKATEDYHKKAFDPRVSVIYTDIADLREKQQVQIDRLADFSPDLILDMSDDFAISSYVYSRYFPTLFLPMRGYQSSSFFTYFGTANQSLCRRENQIYHSLREDQILEISSFFQASPKPETEYKREAFSLGKEDFVLTTVGRRLESELTEDFIDAVFEKLLVHERIKWLVVGGKNEYLWARCSEEIKDRQVVYIPFEDDLPALYQICDVYLNPPRMGGGTSIRWAMHAGLPCALLSTPSDALPEIGVENAAGDTIEEMMEYVLRLFESPDFYQAESAKFRDRILNLENDCAESMQRLIGKLSKEKETSSK